jgi:hypothetical protein
MMGRRKKEMKSALSKIWRGLVFFLIIKMA